MKKIKKIIFIILTVILLVFFICFFLLECYPRMRLSNESGTEESKSWMSTVNDDIYLDKITIPGAHDACASNVSFSLFAQCQSQNIESLLNCGYRYLDIRLGISKQNDKSVLNLYHSFTECKNGTNLFDSQLELNTVLDSCYSFLDSNPSETILFVVKQERGNESVSEFETLLNDYISNNIDKWLLTNDIPKLKDARGKLVLFRRYSDEANLGYKSGIELNWSNQKSNDFKDVPYEKNINSKNVCYVQDRFKLDTKEKYQAFVKTIEDSKKLLNEGIVINFLSTAGSFSVGIPHAFAKSLNKSFVEDYQNKELCGWIIVDFGTTNIAKLIYSNN